MTDNDRQPPTTADAAGVAAEILFKRVAEIIDGARGRLARAVNSAMVQTYWEIGRQIVLVEQQGEQRADYGEQVLAQLSDRLTRCFGRGFSFLTSDGYGSSIKSTPLPRVEHRTLGDNGYSTNWRRTAARIAVIDATTIPAGTWLDPLPPADDRSRSRLPAPSTKSKPPSGNWSVRELERQIASLLYERLAASRDKDDVLALARRGQEVATPQDVVKDPLVLEFLGLPDRPHWRERDLEQAIIDHLQEFMLELGKGFCFVARQKRITLDGDHFFVDLVLYNRLLRCFVLIDLKLGKLSHRDLGQLQMYVNWYDRTQREPHEEPTVGIALCSRKNDAVVRMTLPEGEKRIVAARYEVLLPTAQELEAVAQEGRREAERRR